MAVFVLMPHLDARVSRTQAGTIDCLKVDAEALDRKPRQLFAQEVWINARGHHRAENHVAARAGETVEVESLHFPINGNTSPALPINTSSHRSDNGVRSGFTSQTYAPAAIAISGRPAAG